MVTVFARRKTGVNMFVMLIVPHPVLTLGKAVQIQNISFQQKLAKVRKFYNDRGMLTFHVMAMF